MLVLTTSLPDCLSKVGCTNHWRESTKGLICKQILIYLFLIERVSLLIALLSYI